MALNIAREVVSTIVTAIIYRADGAALNDIVTAFPTPPDPKQVQQWLDALVAAELLDKDTSVRPHRYYARDAAGEYVHRVGEPGPAPSATAAATGESSVPRPEAGIGPVKSPAGDGNGAPATPASPEAEPGSAASGGTSSAGNAPSPEPGVPTSAAKETAIGSTPSTAEGQFKKLFEDELAFIVSDRMNRVTAIRYLQTVARQNLPDPDRRAFVNYGMDRLHRLTLGDCIRQQLEPEQFELWRREFFDIPAAPKPAAPAQTTTPAQPTAEEAAPDSRRHRADQDIPESWHGILAILAGILGSSQTTGSSKTATPSWVSALGRALAGPLARKVPSPWRAAARITIGTALLGVLGLLLQLSVGTWLIIFAVIFAGLAAVVALRWAAQGPLSARDTNPEAPPNSHVNSNLNSTPNSNLNSTPNSNLNSTPDSNPNSNPNSKANSNANSNLNSKGGSSLNGNSAVDADEQTADPEQDSRRATAVLGTRRVRFVAVIGVLVLLTGGLIAGIVWYGNRQHPSEAAVSEYIVTRLRPLPVRVSGLGVTFTKTGSSICLVSYQGVVQTTEPLFRQIESTDYLRTHYPAEVAAVDAANALLKGPGGDRIRAALAAGPSSATPAAVQPANGSTGQPPPPVQAVLSPLTNLVLLTTQTAPQATTVLSGSATAWLQNGSWAFTGDPPRVTSFPGSPAATFAPKEPGANPASTVFAVDIPTDAARLKTLMADNAGYAAKVQAAAAALAPEFERDRQRQIQAFGQMLRPGTLFTGSFLDTTDGANRKLAFEVVECSLTDHRLVALLRNDGGWADGRKYQGTWTVGSDGNACSVTLESQIGDRVPGAGPLLDDWRPGSLVLQVRSDGSLTANPTTWQLRRIDPAGAEAVKADFTRAVSEALAVTKPGTLYRGTVTSLAGTTDTLLIRFVDQDPATAVFTARAESLTVSGQVRTFHGSILGNTYRAAGNPIRLQSADTERARQADTKTLLGRNETVTLSVHVNGSRLTGEDDRFTYDFELVPPGTPVGSTGTPVSGSTATPLSASSGTPVNRSTGTPIGSSGTSVLGSSGTPAGSPGTPVNRSTGTQVNGSTGTPVNRSSGTPVSGSTGTPALGSSGTQVESSGTPVSGSSATPLNASSGAPVNWSTGTPVNGSTGTPVNGSTGTPVNRSSGTPVSGSTGTPALGSSVTPAGSPGTQVGSSGTLPAVASAKTGAYVLDGQWLPLPASQTKMSQSTPQKLGNALTKLTRWEDSLTGKTSQTSPTLAGQLILDSRAYVPAVAGRNVVIVYVGPVTPIMPDLQARYPELKDYPLIELGPEQAVANGTRQAALYAIAPGFVGFGSKRIAATLEWVDLSVIENASHVPALVLRPGAPLPPGRYALLCGAQSYEVAIE